MTEGDPMIRSSNRYLHDGIGNNVPKNIAAGASSLRRHLGTDDQNMRGKLRKGAIYQRRSPNSKPIDYGGNHPYEIKERRRKKGLKNPK